MLRPARFFGLSVGLAAVAFTFTACARAPGPAAASARELFSRELTCPLGRVETVVVEPMTRPPNSIARDPERLEMWLAAAHARTASEPEPKYRVAGRGCDEHVDYTCWERPTFEHTRHGQQRVMSMASCVPDEPAPAGTRHLAALVPQVGR